MLKTWALRPGVLWVVACSYVYPLRDSHIHKYLTPTKKKAEEYNDADRDGRKMGPQSEKHRKMALKLDEIAQKKNTAITSVALAYVMHKAPVWVCLYQRNDEC